MVPTKEGSVYETGRMGKTRVDALAFQPPTPSTTPVTATSAYERPPLAIPSSSTQSKATITGSQSRASYQAPYDQERDMFAERRSQDKASLVGSNKRRTTCPPASIRDFSYSEYAGDDSEREPQGTISSMERPPLQGSFEGEVSGRARSNSALTSHHLEVNRDAWRTLTHGSSYVEPSPEPNLSQFISQRGRPLSFYDMKEQAKRVRAESIANIGRPTVQPRSSWRSTVDTYTYGDVTEAGRQYGPGEYYGQRPPPKDRDSDLLALRLPWTMWMNSDIKNHFVAALGEWVGTTMFLFFAFAGTQVANAKSLTPSDRTTTNATTGFNPGVMLYIAICFGFSLMVNVWVFFRISGGLFNPAVTLALFATRAIGAWRAIFLFVAQIAGSITASALVLIIFPTPLNVRTTLSDGTSIAQGLFIEAFMTAELVFTILMLAKEKHKATFIAPVGIGLALFVAELCGVYYTGGSLNPARSLGPCIVTNTYDTTHWIYWLGPAIGSAMAIGFYKFIKILEYEMANPGQDGDDDNDPTKNPNHEVREKQREMTAKVLSALNISHYNHHHHHSPAPSQGQMGMQQMQSPLQDGERTPQLGDDGFYLPNNGRVNGRAADLEMGYGFGPVPSCRPELSTVASVSSEMHSPGRVVQQAAAQAQMPPPRASPRQSLQEIREQSS